MADVSTTSSGMSTGEKVAIVGVSAVVLFGVVYFLTRPKTPTVIPQIPAPSSQDMSNGAIDANDEAATQAMAKAFTNSPFADALGYISSIVPNYMQGGSNADASGYGTLTINGQTVVPKCGAFTQAVWSAWLSSYVSNVSAVQSAPASAPVAPLPAQGHTQAEATNAYTLASQIASIYNKYAAIHAEAII